MSAAAVYSVVLTTGAGTELTLELGTVREPGHVRDVRRVLVTVNNPQCSEVRAFALTTAECEGIADALCALGCIAEEQDASDAEAAAVADDVDVAFRAAGLAPPPRDLAGLQVTELELEDWVVPVWFRKGACDA